MDEMTGTALAARMRRARVLLYVGLWSTGAALPIAARAQDAPPPPALPASTEAPAPSGVPDAQTKQAKQASASSEDKPIVVTARKREERLLDVPESIDVISGDNIERQRIENVTNLYGTVPNLYLSANPLSPGRDFVSLVIRGVGAASAGSPSVATIVDNVYTPGLTFDMDFLDLERLEVLRGPQGTLFGRNTSGGALNLVVRRPDERVRGRFAATFDEFNTARLQGSVSGPLGPSLFGGAAIDLEHSDGYLKNPVLDKDANNYDRISGRLALRYRPAGSNLDVNLTLDGSQNRGLEGLPGVPRANHNYEVLTDFQTNERNDNYGAALNIDYDFGGARLTSTTGYRDVKADLLFDFDGGPDLTDNLSHIFSHQRIASQELRLQGVTAGGKLHWLAGLYAFDELHLQQRKLNLKNGTVFPSGVETGAQDQQLNRTGIAGFADLTYTAFDRLDLEAGVRVSTETVKEHFVLDLTIPDLFGPGVDLKFTADEHNRLSFSEVSPTLAATFRVTPDFTTYARFAQGYKAGGFPLAPVGSAANQPFLPETSYNYEVGMKGRTLGGRLGFGASAFYIDMKDQQLATIIFLNGDPSLPVAAVGNAGRSRSQGFEASVDVRPVDRLTLSANAGYTDAQYTDYVDTTGVQRAGERFPYVPKWTASAAAEYSVPIAQDYDLQLFGRYRYVGDIVSGTGIEGDLQFPIKAYDVVDVRASVGHGGWRFDAFVDNLFDRYIETRVYNANFFPTQRIFAIVAPPRRMGIRLNYKF